MNLVYDIETDGLLDEVTKIHSLVIQDPSTGELLSCADHSGYAPVQEGIDLLNSADAVIGHNILCFDNPCIKQLGYDFNPKRSYDTLILSRMFYTDMLMHDSKSKWKNILQAKKLFGRHSLESWGIRLGEFKQDFGKDTDWKEWSKEMQEYCEQDVAVSVRLWDYLKKDTYEFDAAVVMEHRFQELMFVQEQNQVPFDVPKATKLYYNLRTESVELEEIIREKIKPVKKDIFVPKRDNSKRGYKEGVAIDRSKPFNPGSRQQIITYLTQEHNWTPAVFTDKGNPKVDAEVLGNLPWKEVKLITKYLDVQKVKGRLMNKKKEGWLTKHKDGKITARINTLGAITHRCTHSVVANIPRVTSYRGKECRELFHAGEGMMVGCDASQLELRMLAHYLAVYDKGNYAREVCDGDIHTVNQEAAGLPTRDDAKTFIYGLNYGAGNQLLGAMLHPDKGIEYQKQVGYRMRESFMVQIPAYKALLYDVQQAAKRGYLISLDGRHLVVREQYRALNTLLQGAGALVMKMSTIITWESILEAGIDAKQAINYHDENQIIAYERQDEVGKLMVDAIVKAGEHYNLRCPLTAEYKIGKNWAETH